MGREESLCARCRSAAVRITKVAENTTRHDILHGISRYLGMHTSTRNQIQIQKRPSHELPVVHVLDPTTRELLPASDRTFDGKVFLVQTTNHTPATVLLCVSRSRRWKSASTPSTPALSAARSPSAASLPASGTAALASAPWPVVLTPLRTSTHTSHHERAPPGNTQRKPE